MNDKEKTQEAHLANLREILQWFKNQGATNTDLANGLGLSRPVIIDFMTGCRNELPVNRVNLIDFYNKCTSTEESNEATQESKTLTERFKKIARYFFNQGGLDELLEAAGFLPKENEAIRVTPERFPQISRIVALLEQLDFVDFQSVSQEILLMTNNRLRLSVTGDRPVLSGQTKLIVQKNG